MTSRERVTLALNHKEADRVPIDFGATAVTGMHATTVYKLRQALGLDAPGTPVKVVEPYQLLGEIDKDLRDALGIDTVPLEGRKTLFGFPNEGWKPWTFHDGTPLLVPEGFNTEPEPDGSLLLYPEGDKSVAPSGRLPAEGWYVDAIVRQEPINDDALDPADNLEEFGLISDDDLNWFACEAERLWTKTSRALVGSFGGTSFGDIALVPAPWLKHPKGIRDIEEWYVSTIMREDYVWEVFERQCEIGIQNLARIHQVVGERVAAVFVTGTDFGAQNAPFISVAAYRKLFKPFHKRVCDWVHEHTGWKTFIHSCGSVEPLIEDFLDAGFDIFNPVQCSAVNMEPRELKAKYGSRLTFWGGGVDTQKTLPFGTPEQVREEVKERLRIFGPGGGFVFNAIHNVQAKTPTENLVALFEALVEGGRYPLS